MLPRFLITIEGITTMPSNLLFFLKIIFLFIIILMLENTHIYYNKGVIIVTILATTPVATANA